MRKSNGKIVAKKRALVVEFLEERRLFSTLLVGPGQTYTTIDAALAAAKTGDTISVASGTYAENGALTVTTKNITLTATAGDKTAPIITGPIGNNVWDVTDTATGFKISGFNIQGGRNGIRIGDGSTTSATATITDNTISGYQNSTAGIVVENGASATIGGTGSAANIINGGTSQSGTFHDGVEITAAGTGVTILDNTIEGDSYYGVYLQDSPTATIQGNTISGSTLDGVYVFDGSTSTTVSTNTISSVGVEGIYFNDSTGSATGNKISAYGNSGIDIDADSNVTVTDNTVNGTGGTKAPHNGIEVGNGSTSVITGNTVTGNELKSTTNTGSGILLYKTATGVKVLDNSVEDNDDNLVLDYANGAIVGGTGEGNYIYYAVYDGIDVFDTTSGAVINHNISKDNGFDGIYIESGAKGNTISDNQFESNGTNTGAPYYYHGVDEDDTSVGTGTDGTGNTWTDNTFSTSYPSGLT